MSAFLGDALHSSFGSDLDFKHKPRKILGDPNLSWEAAERLGIPISETALLMGTQERKPFQQSALLRAKIGPTGLYTVRSQNIPLENITDRQAYTALPQTARVVGALAKPGPILMTSREAHDERIGKPYLSSKECKRADNVSSNFGTLREQTQDVRQGLADMSARYGTNMVPPQAVFGHFPVTPAEAHAAKGIMMTSPQQVPVSQPTAEAIRRNFQQVGMAPYLTESQSYPTPQCQIPAYGGYGVNYPVHNPVTAPSTTAAYYGGQLEGQLKAEMVSKKKH